MMDLTATPESDPSQASASPPMPVSPVQLADPVSTFDTLSSQDWSFTDDNTAHTTHDLHPYPAKFIPQLPANLIVRLSMPGDLVLDPFGGSATTAVEAVRLGRRVISLDANPLSAVIGRAKTGFLDEPVRLELERLSAIVARRISPKTNPRQRHFTLDLDERTVPPIPNVHKWFEKHVIGELCFLREAIDDATSGLSRDLASVALSRLIVRVSNQESETRYVSTQKDVRPQDTLRLFVRSLTRVLRRLKESARDLQYSDARFLVGDTRFDLADKVPAKSVDLIVTSPPYANATDYHLYHRFRMFWLGFDPRVFGRIEIGSHLRHQRDASGFEEYVADLKLSLDACRRSLAPGRYASFVVGDARFRGATFSTSTALCSAAESVGFDVVGVIDRHLHRTRRSFSKPAQRARTEQIVVLQKPNRPISVWLAPPPYRMWEYERDLRCREIASLTGAALERATATETVRLRLRQPDLWQARRLAFTQSLHPVRRRSPALPTWQRWLEHGDDTTPGGRKDPKYATHGIHPFKGKFYPQLAKSLINISGAPLGSTLLDPYCGSGTAVLEGMLSGLAAYGCDLNPLAAKIAMAKTSVLILPRQAVESATRALLSRVSEPAAGTRESLDQFPEETRDELCRWFPVPVLNKLNWLLDQARRHEHPALVEFFEVVVSSLVREVSQQDPSDLRIRRRKPPLEDAPVLQLFHARLLQQYERLDAYWTVAGRQPGRTIRPIITCGDSSKPGGFRELGLASASVDCVVTSPPYATALPYIDTDRLSLLAVLGLTTRERTTLESQLTGSREIRTVARRKTEEQLLDSSASEALPPQIVRLVRRIYRANRSADVGFRRANMPALLWRYFLQMRGNLRNVSRVLKPGAKAIYVVGDSRTRAGDRWTAIDTCDSIVRIGQMVGLRHVDSIEISVTRDNHKHIRNAITKNRIEVFQRD